MKKNIVIWIRGILNNLCEYVFYRLADKTVENEIHLAQKDQTSHDADVCVECKKESVLEVLKDVDVDIFYYIETSSVDNLEKNFNVILQKINDDQKIERAVVCFDRLLERIGKKVDFTNQNLMSFYESDKDFRFKLIVTFHPDVDKNILIILTQNNHEDVRNNAQRRLKKEFGINDSDFHITTIKDVLYLAKYFAIDEKSEMISLEHIKKSAVNFEIIDQELARLLDDVSRYQKSQDVEGKIRKAKEGSKMDYDIDCKTSELLSWLIVNNKVTIFNMK